MEIKIIGEARGDDTYHFTVILDKEYTVEEFVNEIIKDKYNSGEVLLSPYCPRIKVCSFSKGVRMSRISEKYKDKKVISAYADGGYSLMDYVINISK